MRLRALLELARLSNAPTVVTNALVGAAIAARVLDRSFDWPRAIGAAAACVLLYSAGMGLNDLVDRDVDARERSGRPLPSGRMSVAAARAFVAIASVAALALLGLLSWPALLAGTVLLASIVVYNLIHQRWAGSVVVMGACRALVPVVGALSSNMPWSAASGWRTIAILGGGLWLYVILLSLVARTEADGHRTPRRSVIAALPLAIVIPLFAARPEAMPQWVLAIAAALGFLSWTLLSTLHLTADPPRPARAVMGWIAGIALFDAFALALLGSPAPVLVAAACWLATVLAQRAIAGS
ncbi:MAG: UbiA family prenyltransferase [Phycisphaerales bacterium]|nr:UbiA family prenyltransferase [Phycisphaerales bacterium]